MSDPFDKLAYDVFRKWVRDGGMASHKVLKIHDKESKWSIARFGRNAIKREDDNFFTMHIPCGATMSLLVAEVKGCHECHTFIPEKLVRRFKFLCEMNDL